MNATCQVAHLTTGRIRLQVANLSLQPEVGRFLVEFFMRIQGVTGVQLRPATASVVISYDPALCTQDTVLDALRSRVAPQPALAGEVSPEPAASGAAISYPYLESEVIHAIAGRARLSVPICKTREDLGGVLAHFLGQQAGIHHVRLSLHSRSIVVEFDPHVWEGHLPPHPGQGLQPERR